MKIIEKIKKHPVKTALIAGGVVVTGYLIYKGLKPKEVAEAASGVGAAHAGKALFPTIVKPTEKLAALGFDGVDMYDGAFESMSDYGLVVDDLGKLGEAMLDLDGVGSSSPVYILFNVARTQPGAFGLAKDAAEAVVNAV